MNVRAAQVCHDTRRALRSLFTCIGLMAALISCSGDPQHGRPAPTSEDTQRDVRAQDKAGAPDSAAAPDRWSTPVRLSRAQIDGKAEPEIVINATGTAIAHWVRPNGLVEHGYRAYDLAAAVFTEGAWGLATVVDHQDGTIAPDLRPQLALNDRGTAIAAWSQAADGEAPREIWTRRYRSGGWDTPRVVAANLQSSSGHGPRQPAVALHDDGQAVLIWFQPVTPSAGNTGSQPCALCFGPGWNGGLWAARSTGDGWTQPELLAPQVLSGLPAFLSRYGVTSLGGGSAMAVWAVGGSRGLWAVQARRLHADSWEAVSTVASGVDDEFRKGLFRLADDRRGHAAVTWVQNVSGRNRDETIVQAAHYADPAGWGTTQRIDGDEYQGQAMMTRAQDPDIAVSGQRQVVVWTQPIAEASEPKDWHLLAATGDGVGRQLTHRANDDPTGGAVRPRVGIDGEGNATAVWQTNGTYPEVWAARQVAGTWGKPERLSTPGAPAARSDMPRRGGSVPRVAVSRDGTVIAVWVAPDEAGQLAVWASYR